LRLLTLLLALVVLAACGEDPPQSSRTPDPEDAWRTLLAEEGLVPGPELVEVRVEGGPPELEVSVVSRSTKELVFGDGLYGARAYTFSGGRWRRIDTADIRTQVAPLLAPGQEASFRLPVREAESYRVLVPSQNRAAWGDSA
jgi:hypothetical protein